MTEEDIRTREELVRCVRKTERAYWRFEKVRKKEKRAARAELWQFIERLSVMSRDPRCRCPRWLAIRIQQIKDAANRAFIDLEVSEYSRTFAEGQLFWLFTFLESRTDDMADLLGIELEPVRDRTDYWQKLATIWPFRLFVQKKEKESEV